MTLDARQALADIAARAGVRPRAANLSRRGIRDNFEVRCSFKIDGLRFEVLANTSLLHIRLHSESEIAFSTPRPDPILGTLTSLLGQVAGRDVYVNAGGLWSPVPWIYSSAAVAALSAIDIEGGELLTVTGGGPFALVHSAGIDSDWRRLQQLVALARLLPNGTSQESLEPLSLPEELRDLVSLLSRWAISDDGERSDLVESAETADLRDLVDRVQPRPSAHRQVPRRSQRSHRAGSAGRTGAIRDGGRARAEEAIRAGRVNLTAVSALPRSSLASVQLLT